MKCGECDGLGEVPDPSVDGRTRAHGKLERGWRKQWLLGKLARSEGTQQALAQALEVSKGAVGQFSRRHQEEIERMRAELAEQINGLWITNKLNRLAEMQTDVEDINAIVLDKLNAATPTPENPLEPGEGGKVQAGATDDLPAWLRTKLSILRGAAEELGQIPNKVTMQVGGSIVTYKLDGADINLV